MSSLGSKPPVTSHHTQNKSQRPYFDLPNPLWPGSSLAHLISHYPSSSPLGSSSTFSLLFLKWNFPGKVLLQAFVLAIFSSLKCSFTKYPGSPLLRLFTQKLFHMHALTQIHIPFYSFVYSLALSLSYYIYFTYFCFYCLYSLLEYEFYEEFLFSFLPLY